MLIPNIINEYIRSHSIMSLATRGEHLWINTAYYVSDDRARLYFFSSPDTIHGKNIVDCPEVAINIFDSHQKMGDDKVGLQILGKVKVLNEIEKLKWFFQAWKAIGLADLFNYPNYVKKAISGNVYQVTPTKMRFFNEALYGDKESELFEY